MKKGKKRELLTVAMLGCLIGIGCSSTQFRKTPSIERIISKTYKAYAPEVSQGYKKTAKYSRAEGFFQMLKKAMLLYPDYLHKELNAAVNDHLKYSELSKEFLLYKYEMIPSLVEFDPQQEKELKKELSRIAGKAWKHMVDDVPEFKEIKEKFRFKIFFYKDEEKDIKVRIASHLEEVSEHGHISEFSLGLRINSRVADYFRMNFFSAFKPIFYAQFGRDFRFELMPTEYKIRAKYRTKISQTRLNTFYEYLYKDRTHKAGINLGIPLSENCAVELGLGFEHSISLKWSAGFNFVFSF